MDLLKLNIALVPDPATINNIIKISGDIARTYPTFFTLDNIEFFVHMTVYSTYYPRTDSESIIKEFLRINVSNLETEMEIGKMQSFTNGYVEAGVVLTDNLMNFHTTIIKEFNPLREKNIPDEFKMNPQEYLSLTDNERKNIQEFGKKEVVELYRPHITITRLKTTADMTELSVDYPTDIKKAKFENLILFEMGPNGTCIKPVEIIPLACA